jgi:hypothetical protein
MTVAQREDEVAERRIRRVRDGVEQISGRIDASLFDLDEHSPAHTRLLGELIQGQIGVVPGPGDRARQRDTVRIRLRLDHSDQAKRLGYPLSAHYPALSARQCTFMITI